MAGPDPAIHVFDRFNTWMPGKRPGLTNDSIQFRRPKR
jgi:hypothetical protein